MPASQPPLELFVSAPLGIAPALRAELQQLGASAIAPRAAGVRCRADLATAYRICLWSRLASRVLLRLATFPAPDEAALYRGACAVDWPAIFDLGATFAIRATLQSAAITHSGFAAQRVKDAVADTFRAAAGARPSVDKLAPDVRIHLHLQRDRATLSLDLAGDSLHRRGYREEGGRAPLKENLAAAILHYAGWSAIAARGGALLDPMCGSGTLLLEGGMIAAGMAPGLARARYGFLAWREHQPGIWQSLREEARAALVAPPLLLGFDIDSAALRIVREAAQRVGLEAELRLAKRALGTHQGCDGVTPGLVISNPPYGERLADAGDLPALYRDYGRLLKQLPGWRGALFTGNPDLAHRVRLPVAGRHKLYNGALPCVLFDFGVAPAPGDDLASPVAGADAVPDDVGPDDGPGDATGAGQATPHDKPQDAAFGNRLRKNLKHLRRWARREQVSCYRVYDADIPEYAFAIDYYGGDAPHAVLQEYAPPRNVDERAAAARRRHAAAVVGEVLVLPEANVHYKSRRRQRGAGQYQPVARAGEFDIVEEGGLRFQVNFSDYLDTGLFLDQRRTRQHLRERAAGGHFLNLFAYTGAASVYAAAGGAASTTTVDLSNTYLDWAQQNLVLNNLQGDAHTREHADCLAWLERVAREPARRWDYILLDPPSFSNSGSMRATLDIQRDHAALIERAMRLLTPQGVLLFSTPRRRFRLDAPVLSRYAITDLTAATTSPDFARRPAHQCWEIRPGV